MVNDEVPYVISRKFNDETSETKSENVTRKGGVEEKQISVVISVEATKDWTAKCGVRLVQVHWDCVTCRQIESLTGGEDVVLAAQTNHRRAVSFKDQLSLKHVIEKYQ